MLFLIDEEAASERTSNHHIQAAQSLFPSCLCTAVVPIIGLLDDAQVTPDGVAGQCLHAFKYSYYQLIVHLLLSMLKQSCFKAFTGTF